MRVLIFESSVRDFNLIRDKISAYFIEPEIEHARNKKEFITRLSKFKPDLVISESIFPDFDGFTALHITHEMYPDLPFIIVTKNEDEIEGVVYIKKGASDYILKKNLDTLPTRIEEAIKKFELIKEARIANDLLRESEKRLRFIVDNARDLIYRYEFFPKRGFTYVSPSATLITGYTPEDHYNDPDLGSKIVHPEDRYILEKLAKGEIKLGEPVVFRWIRKDGQTIWTEQINVPVYDDKGNLIAIEGIARDVTDRMRLEEELKESEFKFRMISKLITDYAYSFLVDEKLNMKGEWVSESFTKVFGWTIEEVQQMGGWQKCFYEEDLPQVIQHSQKVLSGEPDVIECRMVTRTGELRWIRDFAVPVYDNHSRRVKKIFGVAEDITERKKLEDELKQRIEHFEKLAESTNTAIFVYQGENFVYINSAAERITGYSKAELLKMKFYEMVHPDFRELVKERGLRRQRGEHVPVNYEFKIITKKGYEKWIDFTGARISWFGKPAGLGTAFDITPLKKALDSLENTAKRYKTLFENLPVGILIENSEGVILDCNKKYLELTGYKKEELIGKFVGLLASPENQYLVKEHIKRILEGKSLDHIVESRKKDGSIIYAHLIETQFVLPDGSVGILSICEDLTEKIRIQNELVESEKKFRTIFETANEGICIVDDLDIISDVNHKFCELTGYSKEELVNQNFNDFLVYPEEKEHAEWMKQLRINKQNPIFERRLMCKNGELKLFKVSSTGIFENDIYKGSFGFFTDITEQKRLEEELKNSEEKFRLIWEESQDGMRLTDENGKIIMVNKAFSKMVGLSARKLERMTIADLYLHRDKSEILKKHIERFKTGKIKTHFESEVKLHDGRKVWFEVTNSFIKYRGKDYLLGIFRDITERKKLEQELVKSEQQFRMIWEKSYDAMMLTDENGIIRQVNPVFCELVDMKEQALLNQPFSVTLSTEIQNEFFKTYVNRFRDITTSQRFEDKAILHNGRVIYFEASISPLEIHGEKLFVTIIRDITERKKLIDELIRAKEEAEEANRLKSGFISMMSHEIRTPLNVILGFTNVINELYNDKSDQEINKYFEAIEKSGKRLLVTITQILDISRIEAGEFEINLQQMNLNQKVQDAIQQIQVLADRRNIKFEVKLDQNIPELILDEYCVDGILINLINNAVKFSFENSKIEISTELKEKNVEFRIRDYGIGMSEEYQKHLFQPFSQEEVGYGRPFEGTGLGLALTKKFVELLHGQIKVWSKKGEGTEFTVIFPLP